MPTRPRAIYTAHRARTRLNRILMDALPPLVLENLCRVGVQHCGWSLHTLWSMMYVSRAVRCALLANGRATLNTLEQDAVRVHLSLVRPYARLSNASELRDLAADDGHWGVRISEAMYARFEALEWHSAARTAEFAALRDSPVLGTTRTANPLFIGFDPVTLLFRVVCDDAVAFVSGRRFASLNLPFT